MAPETTGSVWELAASQHGVVTHHQLRTLGYGAEAIRHRLRVGRLHRRAQGVYAVGRPDLTWHGRLMVAVLSCGPTALISHATATALYALLPRVPGSVEVTVATERSRRRAGVTVHCRGRLAAADRSSRDGVPVTSPARTLVDIATRLSAAQVERAVNQADAMDLVDPESLRAECARFAGQHGVARLRSVLDRRTFRASDSRLEQRFLGIVRRTALPLPVTQRRVDGFRTDFVWPLLGLVVETDSLRYHRTPAQQHRDRLRDQAHFSAGRTPLRFTHAQVFHEPEHVERVLETAHRRLGG